MEKPKFLRNELAKELKNEPNLESRLGKLSNIKATSEYEVAKKLHQNFREKIKQFGVRDVDQITTRGDGILEKGASFDKNQIDFASVHEHLNIHRGTEIAGSQFNGKIFSDPAEIIQFMRVKLSQEMNYDQFGRCEITITFDNPKYTEPLGWTGVESMDQMYLWGPDLVVEKKPRMPGGIFGVEDGIEGSWYPETARNVDTGKIEVVKDQAGNIKNPNGKFEPFANIATVPSYLFEDVASTNKVTMIIQKDRNTGRPSVLTIFPGDNAPSFPVKIQSENFSLNTLIDSQEARFWDEHMFIQKALTTRAENEELVSEEDEFNLLGHKEMLRDIENLDDIVDYVQIELDDYIDKHDGYMSGYHFEDIFKELSAYFLKLKGLTSNINLDKISNNINTEEKTEYNSYDEGIKYGVFYFMGKNIFNYSSHDDGYGMGIDPIEKDNLKMALAELFEKFAN